MFQNTQSCISSDKASAQDNEEVVLKMSDRIKSREIRSGQWRLTLTIYVNVGFRRLLWLQTLTTSKKKSTCGLLCTKNLTGCLSMTTWMKKETVSYRGKLGVLQDFSTCRHMHVLTLRIKSGGVPGLTVGLRTPSWCEWISVSSKSRTKIFLFTASGVDRS